MPRVVLIVINICLLAAMVTDSHAQPCPEPINKQGLLKVLKKGVLKVDLKVLIEEVQKCKVSFQLTSDDEQKIRYDGRNLGRKGLNHLVAVVRENYVAPKDNVMTKDEKPKPSPAMNQTNINSPGSLQVGKVGRDLIVNQGAPIRTITPDQKSTIISVLRELKPETTIYVLTIADPETRNYAEQIAQAIVSAGWRVEGVNHAQQIIGAYGVQCDFRDAEVKQAVTSAFKKAGVEFTYKIDDMILDRNKYPNAILVAIHP